MYRVNISEILCDGNDGINGRAIALEKKTQRRKVKFISVN
jgi:hypothetical protein